MLSLRLLFLTTCLFMSQVHSQLTVVPRPCGPTTITPTGPIIPIGQCIVPAVIKPLIAPCQPLCPQPLQPCPPLLPCPPSPPCQPLPPLQPLPLCPPTPPSPPPQPCIPKKPVPCVEDNEDEDLDKILYLLLNNLLENRKTSGKKSGSGKGTDCDNGKHTGFNYVDCGDDYEYILPSPYQTPAPAGLYPYGSGAYAAAAAGASSSADASITLPASENGYAPEICLTFRPFLDNSYTV